MVTTSNLCNIPKSILLTRGGIEKLVFDIRNRGVGSTLREFNNNLTCTAHTKANNAILSRNSTRYSIGR